MAAQAPAVDSAFDVALWLIDRALNDNEYLQPQKLHRLMYLAQAYYAVAYNGARLMPATFVVTSMGPIEPTIYRAFENGRPWVDVQPIPEKAKLLLDSVWRKFGAHSVDHLTRMVKEHQPYAEAAALEPRAEITVEAMRAFYAQAKGAAGKGAPTAPATIGEVMRPRVMRSHKGRPVAVQQWNPRKLDG